MQQQPLGLEIAAQRMVRPPGTSLPHQRMQTSLQVLTDIPGTLSCARGSSAWAHWAALPGYHIKLQPDGKR